MAHRCTSLSGQLASEGEASRGRDKIACDTAEVAKIDQPKPHNLNGRDCARLAGVETTPDQRLDTGDVHGCERRDCVRHVVETGEACWSRRDSAEGRNAQNRWRIYRRAGTRAGRACVRVGGHLAAGCLDEMGTRLATTTIRRRKRLAGGTRNAMTAVGRAVTHGMLCHRSSVAGGR